MLCFLFFHLILVVLMYYYLPFLTFFCFSTLVFFLLFPFGGSAVALKKLSHQWRCLLACAYSDSLAYTLNSSFHKDMKHWYIFTCSDTCSDYRGTFKFPDRFEFELEEEQVHERPFSTQENVDFLTPLPICAPIMCRPTKRFTSYRTRILCRSLNCLFPLSLPHESEFSGYLGAYLFYV